CADGQARPRSPAGTAVHGVRHVRDAPTAPFGAEWSRQDQGTRARVSPAPAPVATRLRQPRPTRRGRSPDAPARPAGPCAVPEPAPSQGWTDPIQGPAPHHGPAPWSETAQAF